MPTKAVGLYPCSCDTRIDSSMNASRPGLALMDAAFQPFHQAYTKRIAGSTHGYRRAARERAAVSPVTGIRRAEMIVKPAMPRLWFSYEVSRQIGPYHAETR